jgi:hypothetical protein
MPTAMTHAFVSLAAVAVRLVRWRLAKRAETP